MPTRSHPSGARFLIGVTLLEMLIAMVILALLLAAGIPTLQQYTQTQRIKAAITSLHNDLTAGRGEAVHSNERVVACPGNPSEGCSGLPDWTPGWIVFRDSNGDRQRQESEPLTRHGQGFQQLRITGSASRTDVVFMTDGSTPGSNQSIYFCGLSGPDKASKLVISNVGRIRRDEADGIDESFCP